MAMMGITTSTSKTVIPNRLLQHIIDDYLDERRSLLWINSISLMRN